jgi:hypothetical protein
MTILDPATKEQLVQMGFAPAAVDQVSAGHDVSSLSFEVLLEKLLARTSAENSDAATSSLKRPASSDLSYSSVHENLVTASAEEAVEVQLEQLGFPRDQVLESLLSSHPDGQTAMAEASLGSNADSPGEHGHTVSFQSSPVKRAKTDIPASLLRSMSARSQQVLRNVSSKHVGVSHMAVARLLVRASAALRQGLLDERQRQELHKYLEEGDVDLVHALMLDIGVQSEPNMPLEEGQRTWECSICFTAQEELGWKCAHWHRYCSDCMRRHVQSVTFPKCPTERCGYALVEKDLQLLCVDQARLNSFREAQLRVAIDTLSASSHKQIHHDALSVDAAPSAAGLAGNGNYIVLHCPNESCRNAVLVSQLRRERFACSCGAPALCTFCKQAPYHYHGSCSEVQAWRQRWLEWISGGRDEYFGRAQAES